MSGNKKTGHMRDLLISVEWDEEAKVHVADSDNLFGLNVEAETIEQLISGLRDVIPELLKLNDDVDEKGPISLKIQCTTPYKSFIAA